MDKIQVFLSSAMHSVEIVNISMLDIIIVTRAIIFLPKNGRFSTKNENFDIV